MTRVLVTGGAGFIGSHLVDALLADGAHVTTLDNFDAFYDRGTKERNIALHRQHPNWALLEADIRDLGALRSQLSADYDLIVHLAAKAGVQRLASVRADSVMARSPEGSNARGRRYVCSPSRSARLAIATTAPGRPRLPPNGAAFGRASPMAPPGGRARAGALPLHPG